MLRTSLTESFGVTHPIIQAGMGSDSGWRLAASVSNAGGLGTVGSIGRTPDGLREEIRACRAATSLPFAVNLCCFAWSPFAGDLVDVVVDERVRIVTLSFGDVVPALQRCREQGIRTSVQVQSAGAARAILAEGVDLLIVQGNEAGGHTGERGTLSLAAEVLRMAGDTPVAIAGGIGDGRGLAAVLAMGGAAAVMGTRFKATTEFGPMVKHDAAQKQAIVDADGDQTRWAEATDIAMGMMWPQGIAGRVIANRFTEEWLGRDQELRAAVAAIGEPFGWTMRHNSDPDTTLNWAGESAGLVDGIRGAAEVVNETVVDAEAYLRRASQLLG